MIFADWFNEFLSFELIYEKKEKLKSIWIRMKSFDLSISMYENGNRI